MSFIIDSNALAELLRRNPTSRRVCFEIPLNKASGQVKVNVFDYDTNKLLGSVPAVITP